MIHWFFEWGWLYLMIIMSVVLTVQLIINWKVWSITRKLGAFTVIVLTFHVWEEWVIPGGFHYFYNIASEASLRDRYPMNLITDMITNFGGAVLWFILVQIDKYGRKMSFAVMLFSFAEVAIHLLGSASSREMILATGQYSPNVWTGNGDSACMLAATWNCIHYIFCKNRHLLEGCTVWCDHSCCA